MGSVIFWIAVAMIWVLVPVLVKAAARKAKTQSVPLSGKGANERPRRESQERVRRCQSEITDEPYFSYETMSEDKYQPVESTTEETVEEEGEVRPAFDLKQAIIYNEILNNKYIGGNF